MNVTADYAEPRGLDDSKIEGRELNWQALRAGLLKNAAEEALDQAHQFKAEGKFEQALGKYIWYHNHALEIDESQCGSLGKNTRRLYTGSRSVNYRTR